MTKLCSICKEEKDITAFYPRMGRCKSCHCTKTKQWAKDNREKVRAIHARWRAKPGSREIERIAAKRWQQEHPEQAALTRRRQQVKLYGLTLEKFEEMEKLQDGKCAICKVVPKRRLDIDHHHTSNQVRKLLCSNCNTLIGLAKESPEILQSAISYLTNNST